MGLSGNLQTMLFADLLQWLSLGQKTGTLIVSSGTVEKRIYFKGGKVIASASTDPREYLSEFLMSQGYINQEQLSRAMQAQGQSRMLLGKILVMIDSISEKDLLRLMRMKAEEEIYDLFLWNEGDFQFIDDELPTMEMVPLKVDVTGVIMEGTKRIDDWRRVKDFVPDTGYIPIIDQPIDQSQYSEAQKLIIQLVNGHRSIKEIMKDGHATTYLVTMTLADLARAGAIRFLEPTIAPASVPPPIPVSEPEVTKPSAKNSKSAPASGESTAGEEDEITALLTRAQASLQAGEWEKSLRVLKAAQNLDPGNSQVRSSLKGAETVISSQLKKEGISLSRVPTIKRNMEEITEMNFTPNEGFILSRINGMWDIGSIIKISPMRESDALLIFYRLHKDDIIEFTT